MTSRNRKNHKTTFGQVKLNAERLKDWRLNKQLSQYDAAKRCGISRVTLSRLEAGKPVQELTAAKVAKKLGFKLSELRLN